MHTLPDEFETVVKEILILLSPLLPRSLSVQIRIESGLYMLNKMHRIVHNKETYSSEVSAIANTTVKWITTVIVFREIIVVPIVRSTDIVCKSLTLVDVVRVQVLKTAVVAPAKRLVVGQTVEVSLISDQKTIPVSQCRLRIRRDLLGLWVLLVVHIPEAVQCFVGTFIRGSDSENGSDVGAALHSLGLQTVQERSHVGEILVAVGESTVFILLWSVKLSCFESGLAWKSTSRCIPSNGMSESLYRCTTLLTVPSFE